MMPQWIYLTCKEQALGRLDYALLPQQSLMELLIDGFENKAFIFSGTGTLYSELDVLGLLRGAFDTDDQKSTSTDEIPDIEEWSGVTLDSVTQDVREIDWVYWNIGGSLNIQWLPATVRKFGTVHGHLEGTIDLKSLPPVLHTLLLSGNSFSGTIDLCLLPESLLKLDLSENALSGSLNLTCLPEAMNGLFLRKNRFTDAVNLSSLPPKMKALTLNDNDISGETDFSKLPSTMREFDVSDTQLSGRLVITRDICFGFNARRSKVYFLIKDSTK